VVQVLPVTNISHTYKKFDEKGNDLSETEEEGVKFLAFVESTSPDGTVILEILHITRADINQEYHDLLPNNSVSNFVKSTVV